ncbi:MAG: glycerol-3-phosphate 1-O-acyltransferase PlsY [Candidatus Margulisbacteria bacterium]|nr:glycerol-3-phosphate 1-O-acyltransferase PlsY [Candidatus Margulisiibacteriota bacterium]
MKFVIIILFAYLLGSIPFSHIFPKIKGKDVSQAGTKNIGATNVLVVAGPLMGGLALAGDIGKGYLAVMLTAYFFQSPWLPVLAGLAAIAGHDFSVFLKFKGGKGLATTGGALLALNLLFGILALLFWILLILISRYFIASTLIILGCVPVAMWVMGMKIEYIVFGLLAFGLALYTHREDIKRIVSGKELNTSESIKKHLNK